jgi:hypothetical protein
MKDKIVNIIKEEPFVGKDGLDYIKVTKEILTPRKTFLKGTVSGKYRGDKIPDENDKSDLYDFEIYEAEVTCNSIEDFSKNKPFVFPNDFKNIDNQKKIKGSVFPKSKLPETLPVIITAKTKTFGINVLEPKLYEFSIVRKLHQTEGAQVFGTFNAYITGYVFDYEREEREEIVGPIIEKTVVAEPVKPIIVSPCKCSTTETGETETKGNYIRKKYKCKNHNDNVWGEWEYNKIEPGGCTAGCFSQILAIIAVLIGLFFLLKLLPILLIFVAFGLILFLIGFFESFFKWFVRVLGILLMIAFFSSLVKTCSTSSKRYYPTPVVDSPREVNPFVVPIIDTTETTPTDTQNTIKDSLITRYRSWKDYEGNKYEGKYQIWLSDFKKAHYNKNRLNLSQNSINSYDKIVYSLKEFDKNNFNSVYNLFDSIGKANQLNKIKFAEMIVTFVQDIPYAIVLDKECNPNLYDDRFTKNYLLNKQGECDGPERFGINTPVEFLTNLKGDCDTRTLLLYTILSHYNYDVAMMSSEFYGHSIIGINLPINGTAYIYNNQRYVLWETTAPNCKPGIIPNEISNLNNWRISLKSK